MGINTIKPLLSRLFDMTEIPRYNLLKMIEKHLDGTGKGEFLYDFKNDILMFKIKDRYYKNSVECVVV